MTVITAYKDTPTKTIDIGGETFAYRELGPVGGTPVIFLNHLAAVLDNWDPRVVDGIDKVTPITLLDSVKAAFTFKDPKEYLFFTRTANGKATARQFVNRLKERTDNRDKPISVRAFRNQLKAIHNWGRQQPSDLTVIQQPVLVANGDHDRMVPSSNSADLARRLPNAQLTLYPDAGHGGIFQYHDEFVAEALTFLES
ncbi:alpha/beta hydrolase [Lentzea alba]|uniref:alpha/beta fold hydrolase n=1 Tax=Lentzea alba TaxID=2714351 RepID=UPI0039BFB827